MKRMLKLSCLLVGALAFSVVFAEQPEYWQLPLHEAQRTDAYEQMCKRLRHRELNDAEADLIFQTLLGRFFEQDSLVSLDLLMQTGVISQRKPNDPQLRARIAVHLMRVGDIPVTTIAGHTPYYYFGGLYPQHWVFLFLDALGSPIPGAEVQVFQGKDRTTKELRVQLTLDKNGLLLVPNKQFGMPSGISFTISHPDYGDAVIKRQQGGWPLIYVPLVSINSDAMSQSAWGAVVDSQNNPIAGVQIWPCRLITPGRGRIYPAYNSSSGNWPGCVVTDSNGRFALHFPVAGCGVSISKVPAHSRYEVTIKAPRELLIPFESQEIPCGQETLITLERPELYFRTFVFEDANGPITEPNVLGKLFLGISPHGKNQLKFGYEDLKDGGKFPVGRYLAWMRDFGPGGALEFAPMDVNENIPTQLVFKPKESKKEVTYSGRAVYGFTDTPAQGAFVLNTDRFNTDFAAAMITDKQWRSLDQLGTNPSLDDPALEPLRKLCEFDKITRTDADGRFRMSFPHRMSSSIYVIKQGCVPVYHDTVYFAKDPNQHIELPVSRLLAAAKVSFRLAWGLAQHGSVYMTWNMHPPQSVGWIDDFVKYLNIREVSFPRQRSVRWDQAYTIYVPAGIALQLWFEARTDLERQAPVISDTVIGQPHELIGLGEIDLTQTMPIYVQVVDSAGKHLEGIPVRHGRVYKEHNHYFGRARFTDGYGFAEFSIPPRYQACFIVDYRDEQKRFAGEYVTYQTNGPADANNVYTLQLSDEMLQKLFDQD